MFDVKIGLERSFKKSQEMVNKELRFENVDVAFHERLRKGYLDMAKKDEERFVVVDASKSIDEVFNELIEKTKERI